MAKTSYSSTKSKDGITLKELNKSLPKGYSGEKIIGEGSYAYVVKARNKTLGAKAFKLSKELILEESDKVYIHFTREFERMTKIGNGIHYNIVRSFDLNIKAKRAVMSMDFVDGVTLNNYLENHRFIDTDEVYTFIKQIGGALAFCHNDIYKYLMDPNDDNLEPTENDKYNLDTEKIEELIQKYAIIHNDLSSNNIMRRDDGQFFLLDFGISIQENQGVMTNKFQGYPQYASPEKLDMEPITTASDVYSFGVLMYEMLAGQLPFPQSRNRRNRDEPIPSLAQLRETAFINANPDIYYQKDYPDWLEAMVMKCLEKDPKDRYADAKVFMDEFNANFEKEQEKIKNENLRLTNEKKVLEQKLEALRNFIEKKEEEANWYLHNSKSIKTELTTYQNKANNLENENEALKSEIIKLKEEKTRLETNNKVVNTQEQDVRFDITTSALWQEAVKETFGPEAAFIEPGIPLPSDTQNVASKISTQKKKEESDDILICLKEKREFREHCNFITSFLFSSILAVSFIVIIETIFSSTQIGHYYTGLLIILSVIGITGSLFYDIEQPEIDYQSLLICSIIIISCLITRAFGDNTNLFSNNTLYISSLVLVVLVLVLYKEQKWIKVNKIISSFTISPIQDIEHKIIMIASKMIFNEPLLFICTIISLLLLTYVFVQHLDSSLLYSLWVELIFSIGLLGVCFGSIIEKRFSILLVTSGFSSLAIAIGIAWYLLGDNHFGVSAFELLIISVLFCYLARKKWKNNNKEK